MITLREKIIDVSTGEETWRDLTADEIAVIEKERADAEKVAEAEAAAEAKRQSALSKLAALGLTTDDLAALGL